MKYCVYLTIYTGNKLPMFYIGSTNIDNIKNKKYIGSVSSKEYKSIFDNEKRNNFNLFKIKILSTHETREEALLKEEEYHIKRNVVKSCFYMNKSIAKKNGFYGMDVSGSKNPNYNNKWNDDQKNEASKRTKQLHAEGKLKTFKPQYGENNGRYKDGKTTYKDKNGNYIFTRKDDVRVKNGELVGAGTDPVKANLTKSKNKNMKKYEYVILKTPNGETIKLNWNEYSKYLRDNKINNFFVLKKVKGYVLLEAKLNKEWKLTPPVKRKKMLIH